MSNIGIKKAILEKKTDMIRILETGPLPPTTAAGHLRSGEIHLGLYNYDEVVGLQTRKSPRKAFVPSFERRSVIPETGDRFIYIEIKRDTRHKRGDLIYIEIISIYDPVDPGELPFIGYLATDPPVSHKVGFYELAFRRGDDPDLVLASVCILDRSDVREAIKALISGTRSDQK